jgi:hypothetical protein
MKKSISFAFIIFIFADGFCSGKYISAETLISSQKIKANINSNGKHKGESLMLSVQNLSPDSVFVLFEAGIIMQAEDSFSQNLLLCKTYKIPLAKNQKKSILLEGYCCQSKKQAPKINGIYTLGQPADSILLLLAHHISENNYPEEAVQNAIWVISDKHPVASVAEDEGNSSLKTFLCELLKIECPWYSISYEKDTTLLFSGRHEKLSGGVSYYVQNNSLISVVINTIDGKEIETLVKNVPHNTGEYSIPFVLKINDWEKGTYLMNIFSDENLILRKTFEL